MDSIGTRKPAAMDSFKDNAPGSQVWHAHTNPNSSTGIPVAWSTKSPVGTRLFPRNLDMSPSNVEKTYSYVRRKLGRPQDDKMERINTNAMICGSFMDASMKAAVHVGIDYEAIVRVTRTPEFSEIRPSLSLTQKEVVDQQNEIFGIATIDWDKFHG